MSATSFLLIVSEDSQDEKGSGARESAEMVAQEQYCVIGLTPVRV